MLYQAYQAHSDALAPVRFMAETARGLFLQPWPLIGDHPLMRGAAAACELVSRAAISHSRPEFNIKTPLVAGREVAVREEAVVRHPFCTLLHFAKQGAGTQPKV